MNESKTVSECHCLMSRVTQAEEQSKWLKVSILRFFLLLNLTHSYFPSLLDCGFFVLSHSLRSFFSCFFKKYFIHLFERERARAGREEAEGEADSLAWDLIPGP